MSDRPDAHAAFLRLRYNLFFTDKDLTNYIHKHLGHFV